MNRSFRLVWSVSQGLWVVASEAAKGKSKSKTISSTKISIKEKRAQKIAMTLLTAGAAFIAAPTWAVDVSSTKVGGNWDTDASWESSSLPADDDDVTVVAGSTITVTKGTANIQNLTVNGTLSLEGAGPALKLSNIASVMEVSSSGSLVFNHSSDNYSFSSWIHGEGSVEVKAGTTVLSSTYNSYSGTTTVTAGTLKAGAENAFSSKSDFIVNGGKLDLDNKNQTLKSLVGTSTDAEVRLGSATLTLNQASDTEYQGKITGTGALTKSGDGTLTLSGANTYTGSTTVSKGTLKLGNGTTDGSIASDVSVADGASIIFNNKGAQEYSKVVSGDGTLTKSGAGTLTLSGENTYSGGTTISDGTLSITEQKNLGTGALTLSGGTLEVTGTGTATLANAVTLTADKTSTVSVASDKSVTASGVISGTGALTKSGAGTLTLTGDNSNYTGNTTVSAGTLSIEAQSNLGTGALTLSGGTLALTDTTTLANAVTLTADKTSTVSIASDKTVTASGVISGSGALTKSGDGTLTLSGTSNSYSGTTTVTGGTLKAGAENAFSSSSDFVVNGTLDLDSKNQTLKSLAGTSTDAEVDLGNATLSLNQASNTEYKGKITGTGALTKSGAGKLTLSGENTYSGGTTISEGTLSITEQKNLGDTTGALTLSGGTLEVTGDTTLKNAVALTANKTSTVSIASEKSVTASGAITGSGALTKSGAGKLTLTGTNTYTGSTTVSDGTLQIGNGGTTGSVTGDIELASKTKLNFNRSDAVTFGGNITGSGDVFINSGTVSFANGVSGTNSLTNKAILSIADGKTTSVGGDYTQESSGTLKVGASSLTSFGKLKVKNTATFAKNSKIDVDVTKANSLAAGSMTKVVEAGTLKSEGFAVTDNSALFDFSAVVDGNNVNLTVVQGTDDSSKDDSGKGKPASSDNKVTLLKSVQNQNFTSSLGAASVLDKFVLGGTTGTGMDKVVTRLGQIKAGSNANAELSEAVAQTLPLLSGSSAKVSSGVMQANGNVVAARQSSTANVSSAGRSVETGTSSGDGFISDGHAWVKPVGSWAKQDSRGGVSGYDAETYGIIGGMDGDINDTMSIGFALSYMNTKADGKGTNSTNNADIDAYQVMFYGQRNLGESFHNLDVSWQAGAGVNETNGTRNINFMGSKAKSDYTSYTGNLSAGLERTFTINSDTSLAPSVRASYSYIKDESYKETGADALNLNVDSNTADSFILSVQGDLNQRLSDSLTLDSNVSVGYDVINDAASLTASYAGGGAAFTTEGLKLSPWVVSAGVGVNYALDDATEITVRYDLEGRTDFLSQTATAKFTWMF